jgi:N-acetylmuramoyl-L-alanine amidase
LYLLHKACPTIVSRAEWGARAPSTTLSNLPNPVTYAVIHHSAGAPCTTKASCITTVKNIQTYHMNTNGWSDIGYNFLVGEDGNVYEGRG